MEFPEKMPALCGKMKMLLSSRKAVLVLSRATSLKAGQRIGHSGGDSGWRWQRAGLGMGGKDSGPGTEAKEGLGKEYKLPEYFQNSLYSYYDREVEMEERAVRLPQPDSGLDSSRFS